MTFEEEQKLIADNAAMKQQLETLSNSLKAMTSTEPTKIPWSGNVEVDPVLVAAGKVVIEPPPEEEPRKLKDNEIRRGDHRRINAHIKEINDGTMVVVD